MTTRPPDCRPWTGTGGLLAVLAAFPIGIAVANLQQGEAIEPSAGRQSAAEPGTTMPAGVLPIGVDAPPSPLGGRAVTRTAPVTGVLVASGGPVGATVDGLAGTVELTSSSGDQLRAVAGPDGTFSSSVPPGTYTARGSSPQFDDGAAGLVGDPLVVPPGGRSNVQIGCPRR